jgi:integrase
MLEDARIQAWIREVERGSQSGAAGAFRRLGNCCETMATSPQELAGMDEQGAVGFLRQLVIKLEDRDVSGVTIRTYIKAIKSWWTFNDLEVTKKVRVKDSAGRYDNERVPTREELQRILDVCSMRERLAVSLMAFCGFRPQVLGDYRGNDGLVIGDLPELETSGGRVEFPRVPSLLRVRKTLSKKRNAYFVFVPQQACDYLKNYLEWRLGEGETLTQGSPLFTAIWHYDRHHPEHVRTAMICKGIRKAIKRAGFRWRPYVLRRYFDVRMMEAEADGMIIPDWRAFWMGHAGSMEATYTVNKALPEATIDKMREAFARAHEKHLATVKGEGVSKDAILALFNRRFLKLSRWTDEEIGALGDLSIIEETRLQELLDQKTMQKMGLNGNRQRVVPIGDVKRYIEEGWEYLSTLPSGEAVIRLPPR